MRRVRKVHGSCSKRRLISRTSTMLWRSCAIAIEIGVCPFLVLADASAPRERRMRASEALPVAACTVHNFKTSNGAGCVLLITWRSLPELPHGGGRSDPHNRDHSQGLVAHSEFPLKFWEAEVSGLSFHMSQPGSQSDRSVQTSL